MYQLIDGFLDVVGIFFIVYLIGYSTFLFLSVVVGSIQLYRQHRQRRLQNYLPNDYHMPISIIVPAWNEAVKAVYRPHRRSRFTSILLGDSFPRRLEKWS